jgi:hypothetical protein
MDKWTGEVALKLRFLELFNISNMQMSSVAQVYGGERQLSFRRSLDQQGSRAWQQLRTIIEETNQP